MIKPLTQFRDAIAECVEKEVKLENKQFEFKFHLDPFKEDDPN